MSDRLDQLFSQLRAYVEERDWSQFHDPKNLAMLIASEAGELLPEYRWIPNIESDSYTADPAARERVTSEVADVAIALFNLCIRLDIDLPAAVRMKPEVIRRNYPTDEVRGSAIRPPRSSG